MTRVLAPLKLEKSPLVLTLAQVRFSPVLQMKEYLPRIQEVLRKDGFPNFRENVVQELLFGQSIKTERRERWLFSNKGQTETVVLTRDFVVLECSRYEVFDKFVERFRSVLDLIATEVETELSNRLGLRYVNLIRPEGEESVFDYLKPGLTGLPAAELGADSLLYRFESVAKTSEGQLALRVLQTEDGTFLPPGLDQSDLAFDVEVHAGDLVTTLDIDHFSAEERDFDPSALLEEFWKLHEYTDRAFRAAVTEHAMRQWEARERT